MTLCYCYACAKWVFCFLDLNSFESTTETSLLEQKISLPEPMLPDFWTALPEVELKLGGMKALKLKHNSLFVFSVFLAIKST